MHENDPRELSRKVIARRGPWSEPHAMAPKDCVAILAENFVQEVFLSFLANDY